MSIYYAFFFFFYSNFVSRESQCSLRETLRSDGNKINCFPRGQGMIFYIAGNFEDGNSLILAVTAVVDGPHSRVTVHSYPLRS